MNITQKKNKHIIDCLIHKLLKLITFDLAIKFLDRNIKKRNYVINSTFAKLLFFITSTKSIFNELYLILIVFLLFLFIINIVEYINNVFNFLIFILKSNRIFNKYLIILIGIICHALYQLVKNFIKEKAANRSNYVSLKNPILDLLENNKIAAFSHQSSLNK